MKEKEEEMYAMQTAYREKLIELEASTEKFQHWFDTLSDENRRLQESKEECVGFENNFLNDNILQY